MNTQSDPLRPAGTSPKLRSNLGEELILIEDRVDEKCVRHVHVMSNVEPACGQIPFPVERGCVTREAGVWHYRAEYPYRGALDVACVNSDKNFRRLVVWSLDGYPSVKAALKDAWSEFCRLFGGEPAFAFMRNLPRGVEPGTEIGTMMLFDAEWMLERCVAVGGLARE